jgi:hypothetical protein
MNLRLRQASRHTTPPSNELLKDNKFINFGINYIIIRNAPKKHPFSETEFVFGAVFRDMKPAGSQNWGEPPMRTLVEPAVLYWLFLSRLAGYLRFFELPT